MRRIYICCTVLILVVLSFSGCSTALYNASEKGDVVQVKKLLEQGRNVNEGNPLFAAATHGHFEIVMLLIENGANPNSGALNHAAANGYTKIVNVLLDKGADVNLKQTAYFIFPTTPLVCAIYNGHLETAKYLMSRGANIDAAIYDLKLIVADWGRYNPKYGIALAELERWRSNPPQRGTSVATGNVIHMNDGSEIRGEIANQSRTSVTVKTKYTTMTIEKKNIKEIKYK